MLLQVEQIRADIRDFQESSGVDKVIILWTANTERFTDIIPGVNDSANSLLAAIQVSCGSISDSVCYFKYSSSLQARNVAKSSPN